MLHRRLCGQWHFVGEPVRHVRVPIQAAAGDHNNTVQRAPIHCLLLLQEPDELFETLAQALMAAVDRDALSGWGGVVHIL